ncbi:hypothetical protein RND81_01G109000 [Saponaria officinalis]|uniref:BZIP domain-containing protein n=1 Tax=Saponaria officinalis TaxID=3572 RepID=A0AAW1NEA2_SAPOF
MTTTNDEINWENIFNFDDDIDNFDIFSAAPSTVSPPATAAVESWVAELEDILLKDDNDNDNNGDDKTMNGDYFRELGFEVSDLLLDIPDGGVEPQPPPSVDAEVVDVVVGDKNSPVSFSSVGNVVVDDVNLGLNCKENSPNFESNFEDDKSGDGDHSGDDPLSKKRKRQLKNRDAAMRSRERKKSYVKDLEMKSRYFEEECRRLGRLLNWCYSENQMLRISLQTYGAPMTKPESAVLLLESLLLGSLVWLMVNIFLLPQSKPPLLNQCAVKLVSVDRDDLESATPRGKGTKISESWIFLSFTRGRRCRASRTKMKPHSDVVFLNTIHPQPQLAGANSPGI